MAIIKGEINVSGDDARGELPPINPATGEPYFEIRPEGWGNGWSSRCAGSAHVDLGGRNRTYDRAEAAIRTLEGMGYTHCGGKLWKPPLGPLPSWVEAGIVAGRGIVSRREALRIEELRIRHLQTLDEIDRFTETPAEIVEKPAPAEIPAPAAVAELSPDDSVPCSFCSGRQFFKLSGGRVCGMCGTRWNAAGVQC